MTTIPPSFAPISLIFLSFYLTIPCYNAISPTAVTNPYCYPDSGSYANNTDYQQNLESAFSILASRSTRAHFYNTTVRTNENDKVYASYYCRYDLSFDVCEKCVNEATRKVMTHCRDVKEALVSYFECSLRYANRNYFSRTEVRPFEWRRHREVVVDDGQLNRTISGTMELLIEQATSESNSYRYFATGEYSTSSNKLHALVQCTSDISSLECKTCLKSALSATNNNTIGRKWGMIFLPNCQMRYSLTPFYDTSSMTPDSPDPDDVSLTNNNGETRFKNPSYIATMLATFLMTSTIVLLHSLV